MMEITQRISPATFASINLKLKTHVKELKQDGKLAEMSNADVTA